MSNCPCGGDHEPHRCKFLDFAPCDVIDDTCKSFWVGRLDEGEPGEPRDAIEIVGFDPNEGEIVARFTLDPTSAEELAQAILNCVSHRTPKRKSRQGAISAHRVSEFEKRQM